VILAHQADRHSPFIRDCEQLSTDQRQPLGASLLGEERIEVSIGSVAGADLGEQVQRLGRARGRAGR
jgi:hypothetical protein